jgi:RNA polymerase sigma factor (sigma-70 family)
MHLKKIDLSTEDDFIIQIKANEKIIHKVIGLYVYQEEDKKDLYQEVLLQAWKSFANFKGISKFSTWLYKVSLHTALSFKRRDKPVEVFEYEVMSRTENPDDEKELYEVLYYLIKQLDEVDRMLMILHLDGYKNFEISEITGMNTNYVNVKIHRIKQTIVERFKLATNGN